MGRALKLGGDRVSGDGASPGQLPETPSAVDRSEEAKRHPKLTSPKGCGKIADVFLKFSGFFEIVFGRFRSFFGLPWGRGLART